MSFRPLVIFMVVSLLTFKEVNSDIPDFLAELYRSVAEYEETSYYKASAASVTYGYDSATYLQGLAHGMKPNPLRLTDKSQKITTLSQLLNVDSRADLLGYKDAELFNQYIKESLVCSEEPIDCDDLAKEFADGKEEIDEYTQDPFLFRTYSGVCNNLKNPLWGKAFTHQNRAAGRGLWEKTALVTYDLESDDPARVTMFSPTRIGASPPKLDEEPYLFKVSGTGDFYIAGYDKKQKTTKKEDIDDSGIYIERGALSSVKYLGKDTCELAFQIGGNEIKKTSGSCTAKVQYKYYNYDFLAIFKPGSGDSELHDTKGSLTTWPGDKFGEGEFTRYWMNIDKKDLQFGVGTEFIDTFVSEKVNSVKAKDVVLAIGATQDVKVQFVSRDVYELETGGGQTFPNDYGVNNRLINIPWVYRYLTADTFHIMRLGVKPDNGDVSINLHDKDGEILTTTLNFDDGSVRVEYPNVGVYDPKPELALPAKTVDFETVSGDKFKGFNAVWLAVFSNGHLYFGYGNTVGRLPITTSPVSVECGFFWLDFVSVQSTGQAVWMFDIEQINIPSENSFLTGEPKPSALDVGTAIHSTGDAPTTWSTELTMLCFQWGQFLDHDIVATPLDAIDGHPPLCCKDFQIVNDESFSDVACFNIPINDNVLTREELAPYDPEQHQCMGFSRSAHILDCSVDFKDADDKERQQMNAITPYIDGSNVYGSAPEDNKELRNANDPALMAVEGEGNTSELPEADPDIPAGGEAQCASATCRIAGDERSQENSGLNAMHTLWVREHNRIVEGLRALNADVDDFELFEWARHIVAAEMQVINYREYFPSYVSSDTIKKFNLEYDDKCRYKDKTVGSSFNVFGLLYRLGHTWIPFDLAGSLDEPSPFDDTAIPSLPLSDNFFNAEPSFGPGGSNVVIQNWNKKCAATDRFFEKPIIDGLFANLNELSPIGFNLAALNIQRGRDHGTPTYNGLRNILGLQPYANIQELCDNQLDDATCKAVKKVYQSIEDIDTFTAGMIEKHVGDSPMGEILNGFLGWQFERLKEGDRFWWTCYFNKDAIKELQKVRVGRVMCDNVKGFDSAKTQEDMFKVVSSKNKVVSCEDREEMDLSVFLDNGGRDKNFFKTKREEVDKKEQVELEELLKLLEEIDETGK